MDFKNLLKIFPYIKDKKKLLKLKIDEDSVSFISYKEVASKISTIALSYLNQLNKNADDIYITDATAGVGGNTISFCMTFGFCTAIEIDKTRSEYLKNNLDVYELKNYDVKCADCLTELKKIKKQDIVFIDPPWGGKNYKSINNMRIKLSNVSLEDICEDLLYSDRYECNPKMIILKLPLNYDIMHLYSKVRSVDIYVHKLKKMYIFIIIKK